MALMKMFLSLVVIWTPATTAAIHYLLVGTFSTNSIYTLSFDDETNQLTGLANTSTPVGSSWLTLSKDKRTLYGTAWDVQPAAFVSYAVEDEGLTLTHQATVLAGGGCTGSAIFVLAAVDPPYTVCGNLYYRDAQCGTVFATDPSTGALVDGGGGGTGIVQNYTYDLPGSAVHGMTWSPAIANVVYSADTGGNAIWTHSRDKGTGALTPVDKLVLPVDEQGGHCGPRHLAVHRQGLYMYVVCEASSKIIQLWLDSDEFMTPHATDNEWPLLRSGDDATDFWADEVLMSASGDFMWASNRAHDSGRQGYVSVFALRSDGEVAAQMFLQETATSGGFANAIAPSPFDDRVAALTENVTGSVEIWRMADDNQSASVVAHLDIPDGGGCCANVVWYS
ncbi:3-carboxy-cis-cis-mucoante lactonizing enzyme [Apiospora hydei]|uniref:3-carboxy-cis-cis-mucoante lactonizing enzyme n=1 Tax=Apiospora hydei TaxID=1337664 RepID=A0ABR1VUR1_9PEZI